LASWNRVADAYAHGQASGIDYYRYEFFGPAQLAVCGEVGGREILDVGCGNGYFARALARRGARVAGIDISPRMIEHATRQEAAEPLGIEYRVLDAALLPAGFAAQSFDMVTSCMALQDMPGVENVFQVCTPDCGPVVDSSPRSRTRAPIRPSACGRRTRAARSEVVHRSLLRARVVRVHLE